MKKKFMPTARFEPGPPDQKTSALPTKLPGHLIKSVFHCGPTQIAQYRTELPDQLNLKFAKNFVKMPDMMNFLQTFVQSGNSYRRNFS